MIEMKALFVAGTAAAAASVAGIGCGGYTIMQGLPVIIAGIAVALVSMPKTGWFYNN